MAENYKVENWKNGKRLVQRDSKGRLKKVVTNIQTDVFGNISSGYSKGKMIYFDTGLQKRKEAEKEEIFRTSYVLNQVPISKNGYFGFRIVAFSDNKSLLASIKNELKEKLIQWIEKCVKYSQDEFWFDMYFGYEAPSLCNASKTDIGTYELTMENSKGSVIQSKTGRIENL